MIVPNGILRHTLQQVPQYGLCTVSGSTVPKSPRAEQVHLTGVPVVTQPESKGCGILCHRFKNNRITAIRFTRAIIYWFIKIGAASGDKTEIGRRIAPLPQILCMK